MLGNRLPKFLFWIVAILITFFSCIDETFESNRGEGNISFRIAGEGLQTRVYQGEQAGNDLDKAIYMIRVLAFDNANPRQIKYNKRFFGAALNDVLSFKIIAGSYDFVFLANEPGSFTSELDNLSSYIDLQNIAYPESAFTSTSPIPMIAGINDVAVSSTANTLTVGLRRLAVRLDIVLKAEMNLGDGTDPAKDDFKGITLSGIPDRVPLVWGLPSDPLPGRWDYDDPEFAYTNAEKPVSRNIIRSFTVADNPEYFGVTSYPVNPPDGLVWAKNINRIILPANYLSDDAGENIADNATVFTANLSTDKYSPSCELKIASTTDTENPSIKDDYKLPANAFLDFNGNIKQPIGVNVVAKNWTNVLNNWEISGERILNVSHTSASITDFNGVRISFYSNMPRVSVVKVTKNGTQVDINTAFNDLADPVLETKDNKQIYSTTRFYYNQTTGSGYMDVISDGGKNYATNITQAADVTGEYVLTLSADDGSGGSALQREIPIEVNQYGLRFARSPGILRAYQGVFYRDKESGERIITGQHDTDLEWSATVLDEDDWIILSKTPSFDPEVGKEIPGKADDYPVTDGGKTVKGKGRIYFRVGLTGTNLGTSPRYGAVELKYYPNYQESPDWIETDTIYIRQGEQADYVYEPDEAIGSYNVTGTENGINYSLTDYQPLAGQSRGNVPVRISPYNLTATELKGGGTEKYYQVSKKSGEFVEYPSQGGAFFQWGLNMGETEIDVEFDWGTQTFHLTDYWRAAYNPVEPEWLGLVTEWGVWVNRDILTNWEWKLMWNPNTDDPDFTYDYGATFETCPGEYRRPTDGPTNEISYNGPYPTLANGDKKDYASFVAQSELRLSLFKYPFSGDGNEVSNISTASDTEWNYPYNQGTYPPKEGRSSVPGTSSGLYADGFFDRRPIHQIWANSNATGHAVSIGNADVAYPGLLFFNERTKASVFFPNTGRIVGDWSYVGVTGYYMSSSVGPYYTDKSIYGERVIGNGTWVLETEFYGLVFKNNYPDAGVAIRCVKD